MQLRIEPDALIEYEIFAVVVLGADVFEILQDAAVELQDVLEYPPVPACRPGLLIVMPPVQNTPRSFVLSVPRAAWPQPCGKIRK